MKRFFEYCIFTILLVFITAITLPSQGKIGNKLIKHGIWKNKDVDYVEKEINVKVKNNVNIHDVKLLLNQLHLKVVEDVDELRWMLVETKDEDNILDIMTALQTNALIETVELNGVSHALVEPNDPYFLDGHQWSLKNTAQNPPGGTNDADIDAPEAWNITQGSSDIIIAILDSGIPKINGDLSHPDLNDYGKIIQLVDYVNEGSEGFMGKCKDYYGHGTHVAGIIGAGTNNGIGVAGIANGCKIYI